MENQNSITEPQVQVEPQPKVWFTPGVLGRLVDALFYTIVFDIVYRIIFALAIYNSLALPFLLFTPWFGILLTDPLIRWLGLIGVFYLLLLKSKNDQIDKLKLMFVIITFPILGFLFVHNGKVKPELVIDCVFSDCDSIEREANKQNNINIILFNYDEEKRREILSQQSEEIGSIEGCREAKDIDCELRVIKSQGNYEKCSEIASVNYRNSCYTYFSTTNNDLNICSLITNNSDLDYKGGCYEYHAVDRGDENICEYIESQYKKEGCISRVKWGSNKSIN